jgi:hypothetical protein
MPIQFFLIKKSKVMHDVLGPNHVIRYDNFDRTKQRLMAICFDDVYFAPEACCMRRLVELDQGFKAVILWTDQPGATHFIFPHEGSRLPY